MYMSCRLQFGPWRQLFIRTKLSKSQTLMNCFNFIKNANLKYCRALKVLSRHVFDTFLVDFINYLYPEM